MIGPTTLGEFARTLTDAYALAVAWAKATGIRHRVDVCNCIGGERTHYAVKPVDQLPATVLR